MTSSALGRYAVALILAGVLLLSVLSVYLRSFNEIDAAKSDPSGIKTRIGDFVSADPIGTLPISLIFALNKWPSSRDCIESEMSRRLLWTALESTTELRVCLTRLIAEMNLSQDMDVFFLRNGFRPSPPRRRVSNERTLEYGYSCRQNSPCSRWAAQLGYLFIRPYSLSVRVASFDNILTDVSITELVE